MKAQCKGSDWRNPNLNHDKSGNWKSGLFAACLYMFVAVGLILTNKSTQSTYRFSYPNVITLLQNIFSILLLLIGKRKKLIPSLQPFCIKNLIIMLPVGLSFVFYMIFGMISIAIVSVPMYTTLRRLTIVFVLLFEYFLQGKISSYNIHISVSIMVVGAIFAGYDTISSSFFPYMIVTCYNICTALYLVFINQVKSSQKNQSNQFSLFDFMFYNNIICTPLIFLICLWNNSFSSIYYNFQYNEWLSFGFLFSLLFSITSAFVLNYAVFWNTTVNSALTQTVAGQVKDLITVGVSFFLFDYGKNSYLIFQKREDFFPFLGGFLGFIGSGLYGYFKYQNLTIGQNQQQQQSTTGGVHMKEKEMSMIDEIEQDEIENMKRRRISC